MLHVKGKRDPCLTRRSSRQAFFDLVRSDRSFVSVLPVNCQEVFGIRKPRNRSSEEISFRLNYAFRNKGVRVSPTSNPSGERKRLAVWPHGSFLFLTSIRYPCDSRCAVAFSTFSTSNSSHACGTGRSSGQESLPKHDCAA